MPAAIESDTYESDVHVAAPVGADDAGPDAKRNPPNRAG
jgi:hypothetical protein